MLILGTFEEVDLPTDGLSKVGRRICDIQGPSFSIQIRRQIDN